MSRLIVISNRVSAAKGRDMAGAQGGLAVALQAALREHRGIWFGWSGKETEVFTGQLHMQQAEGVTTATIDLEPRDIDEYYNGYANRTLWPLLHHRIDLTEFERHFSTGYQRVNERFAESVLPLIEPDDVIWVHDYHLLPLARILRARGVKCPIGLFLHIPWPPARLFAALPDHELLVEAMLDFDLIGFQTTEWLESFCQYVEGEMGGALSGDGMLQVRGRSVKVGAFPIGLDYAEFTKGANSPVADQACSRLRASVNNRKLLIGVDRLDYSKGLAERFDSYDRFLTDNPDMANQVVLLQIAPPSREIVNTYQIIRENLDTRTGHINGAHADVDWVPIRYVNRGYSRAELAGFYRAAHIGLVTPLRDGMNLVAKEFVAAQNPSDPGVLILSEFAGAAQQLTDAVLVNPYSAEEVSDAIRIALKMPQKERIRRWEQLIVSVRDDDVVRWRESFLRSLRDEVLPQKAA